MQFDWQIVEVVTDVDEVVVDEVVVDEVVVDEVVVGGPAGNGIPTLNP
jgi:hypothetical protein